MESNPDVTDPDCPNTVSPCLFKVRLISPCSTLVTYTETEYVRRLELVACYTNLIQEHIVGGDRAKLALV